MTAMRFEATHKWLAILLVVLIGRPLCAGRIAKAPSPPTQPLSSPTPITSPLASRRNVHSSDASVAISVLELGLSSEGAFDGQSASNRKLQSRPFTSGPVQTRSGWLARRFLAAPQRALQGRLARDSAMG